MKLNFKYDIKKIHFWEMFGDKFVLDCNSCKWYNADNVTYNILQLAATNMRQREIVFKLQKKYNKKVVQKSIKRLKQLKIAGKLFTSDPKPNNGNASSNIGAIAVNVSHACNLRCSYCFGCWPENVDNYVGSSKIMSNKVAKKTAEWFFNQNKNLKKITTSFFGGEPLLAIPAIKAYLNRLKELYRENERKDKVHFGATTNATTLTEEIQKFLIKEGISFMIASIDGHKEMHDAYRRYPNGKSSYNEAIKNLKSYQKKGGRFTVRGTYLKDTANMFCKGILKLYDEGFTSISMEQGYMQYNSPLAIKKKEEDIAKKQYNKFTKQFLKRVIENDSLDFFHFTRLLKSLHNSNLKIRECGAGSGYVTVSPEGDIYACHKFVGNPKYKMGNVFQGITKPEIGVRLWNNYVNAKKKCRMCWAKYICGGSCHADNNLVNNNIANPVKENCELFKHRLYLGVWLYNKLEDNKSNILEKYCGKYKPFNNTKPLQAQNVKSERMPDGNTMLITPKMRFGINSTMALIWHSCDGKHSIKDIAEILDTVYNIGKFGLIDEIKETVTILKNKGFVCW